MAQTHLLQRNSTFYYHRRVPLPLVEKLGRKVILFSLGTKDHKEAKKLRTLKDAEWDARFDAISQGSSADPVQSIAKFPDGGLIQVVRNYVEQTDHRARSLMLADPPDSMTQKSEIKADIEFGRQVLTNIDDQRGAEWITATSSKLAGMVSVALASSRQPGAAIAALKASQSLSELLREATAVALKCEQTSSYRGHRQVIAKECDIAIARWGHRGLVDRALEQACMQARRTSQCLLPVLLPLLKGSTAQAGPNSSVVRRSGPPTRHINGLPSYAFDGYTRLGRVALITLARRNRVVAGTLARLPDAKVKMKALTSLIFVAEGGICTKELSDPLYDELKRYSFGCWSGLSAQAFREGLSALTDAIPALNDIRAEIAGAYSQ